MEQIQNKLQAVGHFLALVQISSNAVAHETVAMAAKCDISIHSSLKKKEERRINN